MKQIKTDEQGAWWAPLLDFMGDDPEAWTISYLESLGFSEVKSLGALKPTMSLGYQGKRIAALVDRAGSRRNAL